MFNRLKIMNIKKNIKKACVLFQNHFSKINEEPVFILGNHKSGTTAIAALLAEATNYSVTLDLTRAIPDSALQLRLIYGLQCFNNFLDEYRLEFSRAIIKEPVLTIFYNELREFFPKAKFVYIVRDPRDNIRSILNRLLIPGNLKNIDIFSYPEIQKTLVWSLAFDTSWLGIPSSGYIDALSKKWNIFCDAYEEDHILIKYEDFKNDKEDRIHNLAESLNIKVVKSIADKVDVQYQRKGNNISTWEEFYGKDNLALIERNCMEYMKKFNYSPTVI